MNKILEIHGMDYHRACLDCLQTSLSANDADLVCQPAAKWEDINAHLKEQGLPLFFPVSISIPPVCFYADDSTTSLIRDLVQRLAA